MQPLRPQGHLAQPRLPAQHEAAADASPPEDPEQALELPAGAEVELGFGRDLDVVADPDLGPQLLLQLCGEREAAFPVGQVFRRGDDAGLLVGVAGRADADPGKLAALDPGFLRRVLERRGHRRRNVLGSAAGRRRPPRLPDHVATAVDDRGLDLGAAEVDAATQVRHAPQSTSAFVLCRL
jgi:hypothetical protein